MTNPPPGPGSSGSHLHFAPPWSDAPQDRDPLRRARGRLPLPVTVWLAQPAGSPGTEQFGAAGAPRHEARTGSSGASQPGLFQGDRGTVGLTVSSLLVAPGEPGLLAGVVSPTTDLGDLLAGEGGTSFTVHLLRPGHRRLAQHFAGQLPAPPEQLAVAVTPAGPALEVVDDRIFCRATGVSSFGWSLLVQAEVLEVELGRPGPALIWSAGAYHSLGG